MTGPLKSNFLGKGIWQSLEGPQKPPASTSKRRFAFRAKGKKSKPAHKATHILQGSGHHHYLHLQEEV
jgi:hypothetical protein